MGAESYFVHLLPNGVEWVGSRTASLSGFEGQSSVKASVIVDEIRTVLGNRLCYRSGPTQTGKMVIDDTIEVSVADEDGYFQRATLVGCYSWYDEGLRVCYQIACAVNQRVVVRPYKQSVGFISLEDEESFVEAMRQAHQDLYENFQGLCGNTRARLLANKEFYDFYASRHKPLMRAWRALQRRCRSRKIAHG